jgi:hypothetical protein
MFSRFFNWLFRKDIAATKNIKVNAQCSYCEGRGFYQYSIDEVAVYSCTACQNAFVLPRAIVATVDKSASSTKQEIPASAL